ncbi:uncharacterized protein RHOBADRAFT_39308 [Rhodotorula graminis WP1]|uniref:Choline/carnitine acyltransferase domain-containing protein n=1 Tax=Rhodotorula graminis (strain WP1) TaxID=578459 RepID=A0A0N8PZM0_RHOGW|nr:uncharacterized protein RHOBADRAFT_39308 [Rhodotorula graminis WP1]KPV72701.1 hypothetical protein RHOBADRAFT_39308 [Rhodotorula graminis WP1]
MNVPSATPVDSPLYRNQGDKLPRLPVPKLADTLARLSRSCEPLAADHAQLEALHAKLEAFARPGAVGDKLQRLLERKREQPGVRNWLAEDWDEQAYMAYRDSVVVNVSYYFAPRGTVDPPASDPAYVAATIAKTALEFRRLVVKGLLEPELNNPKDPAQGELCNESYKWMWNACRIPASPADYAVKTREDDPTAQHFLVVKRNRFFKVPFRDPHGDEYGVDTLQAAIQKVIDVADREGGAEAAAAPPVGILTAVNRDRWADAHGHLVASSPNNVATLREIHHAAFVIALDEATPDPWKGRRELEEWSKMLWTGGAEGGNRWWDKPLQWVVYRNGEAGCIGEHSFVRRTLAGTPTARMNDYLTKRILHGDAFPSSSASSSAPEPTLLEFDLDSTSRQHIADAEKEFAAHIDKYRVHYTMYMRYGKEGIKKMKTSPDGWCQMLFQLAYYLTFNRACATYEAAQTRRFQLGRTETVRILTPESLAFVQALVDHPSDSSAADKVALFRAAIAHHGSDMKLASSGSGIDRHLFGLKMLAATSPDITAEERAAVMEGDGLFADPLVKESATWRMSTSQIYIRHAPSYGWGPVVEGGLGIPYMIHSDELQLSVTCTDDVPGARYMQNFRKAADMLMDLHEAAARESKL